MKVREASFALRIVRRRDGDAAIIYRRKLDQNGQERLTRIAPIGPLAFAAGAPLLRTAAKESNGGPVRLEPGPYLPLDEDWGARVACYALVAAGLRDAGRLHKAATNLQYADGTEAAWWLGLMTQPDGRRAVRALRIMVEAVK